MLVLSDRVPETNSIPVLLSPLRQLVDRRLAIARRGLVEMRQHLAAGQTADAALLLEKLDEDLHLLRRRLRREVVTAAPRSALRYGCASPTN